jgi:ankyrin repeat protein
MPSVKPDPVDDRTPLMLAACSGDLCRLFDLILSGAEIDKQNSRQWTALMYACWYNQYEIVQQLLDSGANPNIHQSYEMVETPLSIAAQQGHFEIVRLLIAHDADPTCYAGISGVRAEWYARRNGHHDISNFLRHEEDKRDRAKSSGGG